MRTLLKTLCVTLALALAALALPAGVFALGQDVDINETNFPDRIFRNWLLDEGNLNGMGADGVLTSVELAQITALDLSDLGIGDLTGIGHFAALEQLNVNNNRLASLDLRQNTRLRSLYCATNVLEHLDVTGCPELVDLNCERNRLTSLDLSGNPKLVQLYCRHNSLEQLDVSRNPELVFIETFDNSLTSFDCTMLKKLEFLHIDYNKLTTLDMSSNPALAGNGFVAANNHLTSLVLPDVPGMTVEAEVFYEQNPLTGYDNVEWYLDPSFTRPVSPEDVLPANGQTLFARWVPNPYTVYYRPNGGQGSMEPQPAVYGTSFALTPNAFTRTGYTFASWHTYSDGVGGVTYLDGAVVENLAGKNSSRTAVYLYAQWLPNTYTIHFDAGSGEGTMEDITATYDKSVTLPNNAFTNTEGVFLGWVQSDSADQPEYFAGQSVRNLTAENGGSVTFYPVWKPLSAIKDSFQAALDTLKGSYSSADYYNEDWALIENAYNTAKTAIDTATAEQVESLQQTLNEAAQAMSAVPTRTARAEELAQHWTAQFASILGELNAPVSMADRVDRQADVGDALRGSAASALAAHSQLSDPASALAAANEARALLESQLTRLQAMERALGWMGQAEDWYGKPMSEATSGTVDELAALEQSLSALDADTRFFCDPAAVSSISEKARLAREKQEALKELEAEYARLTQWDYTEQNLKLLDETADALRREIETAEASGMPAALLVGGKVQLEQVDPIPKASSVTVWPTAAPLTKGQALSASALTGGKADVPGTFAWKEPDARPQSGGSFTVVFTPSDTRRYKPAEQAVQLTVQEPPATPSPLPTPVPTPVVTPAPTAAPGSAATPVPLKPAATPAPTATPAPSASPTPSPSAAPSASPVPESTPAGTPSVDADEPAAGGALPGFALPLLVLGTAAVIAAVVLVVRARRRP
ncbi:InlB B-repeat-containing protein [Candidatus Allofournierella merdipullorum]|uniref:InlB B-repeat-containing protein n=1 Tax=Candidatus Allofournierella merdipullorum TaxID=2838595 RepID=UPI00374F3932